MFVSVVADARSGKNKTGGPEDDLENVPPINQSVAMAIAGNPFNTLGRSALVSMASMVRLSNDLMVMTIIAHHAINTVPLIALENSSVCVFACVYVRVSICGFSAS